MSSLKTSLAESTDWPRVSQASEGNRRIDPMRTVGPSHRDNRSCACLECTAAELR